MITNMSEETYITVDAVITDETKKKIVETMDKMIVDFLRRGNEVEGIDSSHLVEYANELWYRKSKNL